MMTRRLLLGGALALGASGCYGKFTLTKKLYDWNGSLGNKFLVWIVFVIFMLVPVYGIAGFVDIWIFNLIEFWTGSNPLGGGAAVRSGGGEAERTVDHEDGSRTTMTRVDDKTVRVVRRDPGGEVLDGFELVMEGEDAGMLRSLDGKLLVTNERLSDGTLAVTFNSETTFVSKAQQEHVGAAPNRALAAAALLPARTAVAMR
ncbi:MAG: DUF3332 family protein [Myxococcota bacterium]|jgi:hypothetical protein